MTKFFIQTYGCQMNIYESGVVRQVLCDAGFEPVTSEHDADILLMMTCSVRSHAEARALGRLGAFRAARAEKPGRAIGVLGCMAQRYGEDLVRNERVDLVVGPDCYSRLPELIDRLACGESGIVTVEQGRECYDSIRPAPDSQYTAFVTIMRGCDNYCAYCVVPYVKGRERSRGAASVLDEVRGLLDRGVRDVTLLGQNVLAYRDGEYDFVRLLEAVDRLAQGARIRFLASHPRDLSEHVLAAMRDLVTVCPSLHLPVQSGSDRILGLMNRGYTRADYLVRVALARELIPGLGLTTDVIVGFPSETDVEFGETLDLVQKVAFDFAYMFRYSERPGTKAADIDPRVSQEDAGRRLARLIEVQNRVTLERNRQMVGDEVELLIEGPSPRGRGWLGRTRSGKAVIAHGDARPGQLVRCRVTGITGWTPIAEVAGERATGGHDQRAGARIACT